LFSASTAAPGSGRRRASARLSPQVALGRRLGVPDPGVEVTRTCVDSKRQWRHVGNVRPNSMVRSVLQTLTFRRGVRTVA